MRKRITSFMTVVMAMALLLSAGAFAPEKAAAAAGGWHLVNTEYYIISADVTVLGGAKNVGGGLFDTYTGEGSEGNMKFSHSRKFSNGKGAAHVDHQVVWDAPPSYLAPNQKTGFNAEMKVISSSSNWGSTVKINASFDAAGMTPSGGTASSIKFQSEQGETSIHDKKVYFESSKVIPEGRPGDKRAIYLSLGNGYGYIYEYEWKAEAPPETRAIMTALRRKSRLPQRSRPLCPRK